MNILAINCYPLTQHEFWLGVGCFAYNTFHVQWSEIIELSAKQPLEIIGD